MRKELPPYCKRLSAERAAAIYAEIIKKLKKEKLYRDPKYTASKLAKDLQTNTRYIAASVLTSTGDNFSTLVNSLRLHDACKMLSSKKHEQLSAEEIGLLSGFSSRQSFYRAFEKVYNITPRQYRLSFQCKDTGATE
ncbi:MAG: AraC family transcriptional regulator [Bacteroidaceae bacterium]|nr:AraC family transcriptional regulator [Bacteroidaceae bacterium]